MTDSEQRLMDDLSAALHTGDRVLAQRILVIILKMIWSGEWTDV